MDAPVTILIAENTKSITSRGYALMLCVAVLIDKSDVFSLGMCLFYAACLSFDGPVEIREINEEEFNGQKIYLLISLNSYTSIISFSLIS